jgi:hypothetical protein
MTRRGAQTMRFYVYRTGSNADNQPMNRALVFLLAVAVVGCSGDTRTNAEKSGDSRTDAEKAEFEGRARELENRQHFGWFQEQMEIIESNRGEKLMGDN